jgi:hypothetical protein
LLHFLLLIQSVNSFFFTFPQAFSGISAIPYSTETQSRWFHGAVFSVNDFAIQLYHGAGVAVGPTLMENAYVCSSHCAVVSRHFLLFACAGRSFFDCDPHQ